MSAQFQAENVKVQGDGQAKQQERILEHEAEVLINNNPKTFTLGEKSLNGLMGNRGASSKADMFNSVPMRLNRHMDPSSQLIEIQPQTTS